ncbi:MAG: YsnF/AvaK domain-containing protein [Burkholderiaceae bacterium]|nr:YsnF/AvaK domain-containing protein [Burkholderiaceae bacterium]
MRSTLIGVFDDRRAAERARDELLRAGFADDEVDLRTGTEDRAWRASDDRRLATDRRATDDETETSIGETVSDWFRSLFGFDDEQDIGVYTEAMRRGESVVTVDAVDGDRLDRATDILEDCGSVDIDAMADEWQLQGWARPSDTSDARHVGDGLDSGAAPVAEGSPPSPASQASSAPSAPSVSPSAPLGAVAESAGAMGAASTRDAGEELRAGETRKVPVIEERLRVGKRVVGRRRLRVYTQMVEEPVEENVRLSEEHVHVERRDADRPATEDDFRAAQGASIEATERNEEPVVGKEARVVGEVEIGKDKREREETVRDTVRRTDVDVRKLDEGATDARTPKTGRGI